ncbi:MAG: DNA polymerase III subunit delta' [Thiomicrorhabdus sp.]|nr:DNA polymerase III subunit delta' [Thiomicrorhabdus sp.]
MNTLYPWLQTQWTQWSQNLRPLGHAYLLSSPKGIGIELFVAQVAQKTLCQQPTEKGACLQCKSCHLQQVNQHPDYYHLTCLEDKKEISVEQVRTLVGKLNETSHQGGYKVIWVEGAELLNQSAFNALLKTLEEPAPNTLFLLTTSNVGRLPETIKSRCQQLNFPPPVLKEAIDWLQQAQPHADMKLIQRALRLNWGAPLNALAWIKANKFEEDAQWKEGLNQLQQGQKTVSQVVAQWLKWPNPMVVFDYFYLWSVSAVRSVAYASEQNTPREQHLFLQNSLAFQQATLQAKQCWQGNANKELVLETLCLEWLEVQQSTTRFQSVFQSKFQKGTLS